MWDSGLVGEVGDSEEIGLKIREARLARGWTHEELARRMGVNWRTVQRWQKGRLPRVETLRRLAAVLDIPPATFLDVEGEVTLSDLRDRLAEVTARLDRLSAALDELVREDDEPSPRSGSS